MAAHAWELSKALVQLGHEVTVLTAVEQRVHQSRFMYERIEIRDGVRIVHLGFPCFLRRYRNAYCLLMVKRHIRAYCRNRADAVLHIHEHTRPTEIRSVSGKTPLVFTNHSSMFLAEFENTSNRDRLRRMAESCDWITAPSQELCAKTVALGYPEGRVTYIPNGVDTQRFKPDGHVKDRVLVLGNTAVRIADGACVILCARRFAHKNGLHIYLNALERMRPEVLSLCVLIFAGNKPDHDGDYGQEISQRIQALSRRVTCHLLGPVPNDSMSRVYQVADIAVLPSLKEATSITGLESLASGVPLVGTNVGGIPELVEHDINGLLSPPNDVAALADNLTKLIADVTLRSAMGAMGRRIAQDRFSWKQIAERFVRVYRSALNQRESALRAK
ncbi:MAG TPA: glycosyltransferase family 4 protein [Dissulfurispiraceae bacterium]|nr:glycosyltransferase family 4 protein [Dissulfurispiraceae bacterium]